jgi:hypothetical protein
MQVLARGTGTPGIEALKGYDLTAQGAALGNHSFGALKP